MATSERSKQAGNLLESLGKPVVCALNGMAFGGGNEIAMCCTARIVRKGLAVAVAQPEANLGIVPGAGATQRLPRLVGVEKAAELLRTGAHHLGPEAVACGLVREEVEGDLVGAAVRLARVAARGEVALTPIDPRPVPTPDQLPSVDLGHLSRSTDALICRAIVGDAAGAARRGAAARVRAVRRMLRDGRHAHWHRQLHCQRSAFGGKFVHR